MNQITTYATLQTAVAGMIHRDSDTAITGNLPLFVQLCEAELNDRLLLKDMESDEPLTLVADQNYIALPAGFISPINFWLVISGIRIEVPSALPEELPYDVASGQPQLWAIDGANIRFDCPCASAYSAFLRCIKASNLSVSNTSNALLLRRPDVYLYGTLKQAALFTKDDSDVQKWSAMFEKAIASLKAANNRSKSIVPLRTEFGLVGRRSNILNG